MKKIVAITGSTRGIGLGLADALLAMGARVVLCGRRSESVEAAMAQLAQEHDPQDIHGQACDVSQYHQVQALWDAAVERFGRVDIWINNAGIAPNRMPFWQLPPEQFKATVDTNMLGLMNGARVALEGMLAQGGGALYNMEGLGSDGRKIFGMLTYSTTKYGLRFFTEALIEEAKDTPVLVCALSPGMVLTDLLMGDMDKDSEDWAQFSKVLNILADTTETVCPWLAEKVLHNQTHGAAFRWLTTPKILGRFLLAPFRKRDLFSKP